MWDICFIELDRHCFSLYTVPKPVLEPMTAMANYLLWNKPYWNIDYNTLMFLKNSILKYRLQNCVILFRSQYVIPLQWRHNEPEGVSNHQPHDYLLNRWFRCRSKKTSKLRVTGLCAGNSPLAGEFPAQMSSNAENVSIWWRYHPIPRQTQFANTTYTNDKSIPLARKYSIISLTCASTCMRCRKFSLLWRMF